MKGQPWLSILTGFTNWMSNIVITLMQLTSQPNLHLLDYSLPPRKSQRWLSPLLSWRSFTCICYHQRNQHTIILLPCKNWPTMSFQTGLMSVSCMCNPCDLIIWHSSRIDIASSYVWLEGGNIWHLCVGQGKHILLTRFRHTTDHDRSPSNAPLPRSGLQCDHRISN